MFDLDFESVIMFLYNRKIVFRVNIKSFVSLPARVLLRKLT